MEFETKMELEVTIQEAMAANLGSWINYAYIVEKRPSTGTCPCTLHVPLRYVYFIQQPRFTSMPWVFLLLMVWSSLFILNSRAICFKKFSNEPDRFSGRKWNKGETLKAFKEKHTSVFRPHAINVMLCIV